MEEGSILISVEALVGAIYPLSPWTKPFAGRLFPWGSASFTCSPSALVNVSFSGLKQRSPAMVKATVNSGEATNANVFGLPSARFAKLRLKDVTIAFLRVGSSVILFHWPIHEIQNRKTLNSYNIEKWNFPPISNGRKEIDISKGEKGELTIIFYIDQGFIDHFSAFVYTNDSNELKGFYTFGASVKQLDCNWYRVSQ